MADISKCKGVNCPLRKKCYRYTATEGHWQTWADFTYNKETKSCEYFWDNKEYYDIKKNNSVQDR